PRGRCRESRGKAQLAAGRADSLELWTEGREPMRMGKVIGSVVATRKDPSLEGVKLLVVENLTLDLKAEGGYVVAVDAVGAGSKEVVLYASGSSARQTAVTKDRPVDAVIMAILDSFEAHGKTVRLA